LSLASLEGQAVKKKVAGKRRGFEINLVEDQSLRFLSHTRKNRNSSRRAGKNQKDERKPSDWGEKVSDQKGQKINSTPYAIKWERKRRDLSFRRKKKSSRPRAAEKKQRREEGYNLTSASGRREKGRRSLLGGGGGGKKKGAGTTCKGSRR